MRETTEDLDRLQRVLDDSRAAAGAHLRNAFGESNITAAEVVATFDGIVEMHLAVVTRDGAPLVAPVDGMFVHGRITFGLPATSVRTRVLRRDPRASASFNEGSSAFIVHGTVRELAPGSVEAEEYEDLVKELYAARYGPAWLDWFEAQQRDGPPGFAGWIEPRRLFAKT